MARWVVLSLLLAVSPVHAQTVQPEKLREAVSLPRPAFNFQYDAPVSSDPVKPSLEKALDDVKSDEMNPERHLVLAEAYPPEQKDKQDACHRRVIELLEKRVASGAGTGYEMAMLGRSLAELGRVAEGEVLCRKGVEAAPRDHRAWRELYQAQCALAGISFNKHGKATVHWKSGPEGILVDNKGITFEDAETAARHIAAGLDSLAAMRRAAPVTETIIMDRVGLFMKNRVMMATCDGVRGKLTAQSVGLSMLHPVFIEELLLLGQSRQNDIVPYLFAVSLQTTLFQLEGSDKNAKLNAQQQRKIVAMLEPVHKLIGSPDREVAWKAAMVTAVILEQNVEQPSGEAFFRKALAIAPEKAAAAEMLTRNLATQGRKKEALEVIEALHKRFPSLRTSLLTAHLLFDQKQFDRAEAIVADIAKVHPEEVEVQLALAAFCLKNSGEPGQLAKAKEHLLKAENLIPRIPESPLIKMAGGAEEQEKKEPVKKPDFAFNQRCREHCRDSHQFLNAIYLGLTDQPFQAWAELRTLRLNDVNNTWAEEALKAFE